MKGLLFLILACIISDSFAYVIIHGAGKTQYISKEIVENIQSDNRRQDVKTYIDEMPGYPAKSNVFPGKLESQTIRPETPLRSMKFYLVGSDNYSISWIKNHQDFLRKSNAIGYITNIKNNEDVERIAKDFELHLIPINADLLINELNVDAYPFYFDGKKVWQ